MAKSLDFTDEAFVCFDEDLVVSDELVEDSFLVDGSVG